MSLMKSITCLLVVVNASTVATAQDRTPFKAWLGPQTNETATLFAPVVGKPIDPAKHDKLPRYEISLKIIKGADLKFPESENAIVTFDQTGFRQFKDFVRDKDALYVVGTMQLKQGKLGWRFYTLNVRITAGVLKGAVVHLRDGKLQASITDPCIAVYRVPDAVMVEEGNLPFEVVALFAK